VRARFYSWRFRFLTGVYLSTPNVWTKLHSRLRPNEREIACDRRDTTLRIHRSCTSRSSREYGPPRVLSQWSEDYELSENTTVSYYSFVYSSSTILQRLKCLCHFPANLADCAGSLLQRTPVYSPQVPSCFSAHGSSSTCTTSSSWALPRAASPLKQSHQAKSNRSSTKRLLSMSATSRTWPMSSTIHLTSRSSLVAFSARSSRTTRSVPSWTLHRAAMPVKTFFFNYMARVERIMDDVYALLPNIESGGEPFQPPLRTSFTNLLLLYQHASLNAY